MKKKLPKGISDFKKVILGGHYYIDKTLLIKDIFAFSDEVFVFPRPRRFGKTLNLSMLRYFCEKGEEDQSELFDGLMVRDDPDAWKHQGNYSVIYITLKDAKGTEWSYCYNRIQQQIVTEVKRHLSYLTKDCLTTDERLAFESILDGTAQEATYAGALLLLSEVLYRHRKQKLVVLIDEYDVPIQNGYLYDFYEEAINFIRTFLGSVLKDNINLQKGVITGNLRIAKESIFSDLNNSSVFTLLANEFSQYFGFTEEEMSQLLDDFDLKGQANAVSMWYNGYRFGKRVIYNPWSIISYILDEEHQFKLYWVNTSDNALIKKLLKKQSGAFKEDLERLMQGETIEQPLVEHITLRDLEKKSQEVWTLLLFAGYLKCTSVRYDADRFQYDYCLEIPNREVKGLFANIFTGWFDEGIGGKEATKMLEHLTSGDLDSFQIFFQTYILNSLSLFDLAYEQPERIYHAFVLGMLIQLSGDYEIKSNRESGFGRYDVMIIPRDVSKLGLIIEFKRVFPQLKETLESSSEMAINQIEEKKYAQELRSRGVTSILAVGMAFLGKEVLIKKKSLS